MWSSTFFSLLYSTWCQWFPLLNPHCRFGRRLGFGLERWKFSSQQLAGVTGSYEYWRKAYRKGNLFEQSRQLKGALWRQNRQMLLILDIFGQFWLMHCDSYDPCFTVGQVRHRRPRLLMQEQ